MAQKIVLSLFTILLSLSVFAGEINLDSLKAQLPAHFSGQVYVKQNGETICNYYQGFSERTYGAPINDSTLFNVGEIAHSFVHYFIQHLVTLNQIKISDPVKKYIQNFPYDNITIDHLLNHKSGLPSSYVRLYHKKQFQNMDVKVGAKSIRFDNEDMLFILAREKPSLYYTPGDSTSYSDINYLVVCSIIEQTTFTPFKDFSDRLFKYQNFVFSPVISAESDEVVRKAFGYRMFDDGSVKLFENLRSVGFPFSDGTNGNQHMYLSAKSLSLWGQYIFKKMDESIIKLNPNKNYFGNFKYDQKLGAIVSKGTFGGTYSTLIYVPKTGLNIAITSNVFEKKDELNSLISWLVKF